MTPGKAFWLIVREAGKIIKTGSGKTIRIDQPFEMHLHSQWNFVATPFNFRIPIANVSLKSGNQLTIRKFTGQDWNNPIDDPVTEVRPFLGYAVFNSNSSGVDTLLIDPDRSSGSGTFKTRPVSVAGNMLWSIHILAQCQKARDIDNYAAVYSDALSEWDKKDQPEPPVIGEYVSVYFPYPQQGTRSEIFCIDARPEPGDGEIWEFEVKTNIIDQVNLIFDNLNTVPSDYEVSLIDPVLKVTQDLRQSNTYSFVGVREEKAKRLQLVVGKRAFLEEILEQQITTPTNYELSQNFPNPFNPVTTIRYALPRQDRVTIKIYNVLSEEVKTLVDDEWKAAGYHTAIWNGANQAGKAVGSGVYFYQLLSGGYSIVKKMALVE
jgi:hypothetical protein